MIKISNKTDYCHNSLGFSCLSPQNFEKIFGYDPEETLNLFQETLDAKKLDEKEEHPSEPLPELPELPCGNDVEEYFTYIAQRFFDRYDLDNKIEELLSIHPTELYQLRQHLNKLLENTRANVWTKLTVDGDLIEMDVPDSRSLIFDTETFVKGSDCNSPIVAQALGKDFEGNVSLYMWLHPLFDSESNDYRPMKVEVGENKLLIGHNFSFDRQKIKDFYTIKQSTSVCLCTMAMMKLVGGLTDKQTWATRVDPRNNYKAQKIQQFGCAMGLVSSYEFITGRSLPDDAKDLRKIFVKAKEFQEFRDTRVDILRYSMLDVIYNWELFVKLWPRYREMVNHKAIVAGQIVVLDAIVPHIDYWDAWVRRCDREYRKIEKEIIGILLPHAERIHNDWLVTGEHPPSLEMMNWDYVLPFRHRKDKPLPEDWRLRAKWFNPWEKGTVKIKGRDVQLLLQCEYFYDDEWHDVQYTRSDAYHIIVDTKIVKLPNRKNPGENYGSILSADSLYLVDRDQPLLRSKLLTDEDFLKVLKLFDLTTTYTGFRNRVITQNRENGLVGAQVNPCGTISGRTVSALYNTLPAHWDEPKIMSEIKMTSQCPDGYVFVGGDVDSQESSVAAAMSDSYYGISGSTPFSTSVLVGNKKDKTDIHSLTAKELLGKDDITSEERQGGKQAGLGLIYGAGVKTTAKTVSIHFDETAEEALPKSRQVVSGFKGKAVRLVPDDWGSPVKEFRDGIASQVFNKMGDIIKSPVPRGLFFDNEWPRSLQPRYCGDTGSPSQLNYCIQASCSTYGFLSAWAISVLDEIHRNKIRARFSISVHDEIWFICKEEDAEKLAFWMMICYSRVWALLHHKLGINDLPVKRAFPSSISIDRILRKSCTSSTKTPTFDESEPGREVNIHYFVKS